MALDDDDMTSPPQEPYSEAPTSADEFLDSGNSADGGADGGADEVAGTGDGAGADDATTASDEDPRFA
jgi:hypothetical protein